MDNLGFINDELNKLKEADLLINVRTIEGPQGAWIKVDGNKVLNLCSNNYLGLADDPQLKAASQKAIEAYGVGPAAVRTIAGTTTLHRDLERKLALSLTVVAFQRQELYDMNTVTPKTLSLKFVSRKISNVSLLLPTVFSVWKVILHHYHRLWI